MAALTADRSTPARANSEFSFPVAAFASAIAETVRRERPKVELALLIAEGEGLRAGRGGAFCGCHAVPSLRHLIMRSGV